MRFFLITIFLFLFYTPAHATQLFGCTSGGTFSGSIWVTTTGAQAACTSPTTPGTTNDLVLNSSTGNITISGAAAANSFDMTGYAGTLAFGSQTLTVLNLTTIQGAFSATTGSLVTKGGVTLAATPTGASFPSLTPGTSAQTFTSGGFTWPGPFLPNLTGVITLVGSWTNTGLVTYSAATNFNFNSSSSEVLNVNAGLTMNSNTGTTGTATIVMGGGTWSGTGIMHHNFNLAGTITVSGTVQYGTHTLKYVSGTITTTSSTLEIFNSLSLDTSGVTWNAITIMNAATVTLVSNLSATGAMTINGGILTMSGSPTVSVGSITMNKNLVLASNWSVTGTVTVTATLTFSGAFTLTADSFTSGTSSTTLTSTSLTLTNLLSSTGNPTFLGTGVITTATLTVASGQTWTWPAGNRLVVTTNLNINNANGATTTLVSGTASSKALLIYQGTYPNQHVFGGTFTDIDASLSNVRIYNWAGGTLTRTANIFNINGSNIGRKNPNSYWGV